MKCKFIFILIALMIILTGCGSGASGETNATEAPVAPSPVTTDTSAVENAEPLQSTSNEPALTMGQENALGKAYDYLDYSAFSYSGLVAQLEYEGFSNEDAVYAVDRCGANWDEQAAKKAADYLEYSSFSRQGLIDQLVYEGFSSEQATYGVTAVGY